MMCPDCSKCNILKIRPPFTHHFPVVRVCGMTDESKQSERTPLKANTDMSGAAGASTSKSAADDLHSDGCWYKTCTGRTPWSVSILPNLQTHLLNPNPCASPLHRYATIFLFPFVLLWNSIRIYLWPCLYVVFGRCLSISYAPNPTLSLTQINKIRKTNI